MTFKKTLLAAAMLVTTAVPAFATEQAWHSYKFWDWDGAYVSAKGGLNWQNDSAGQDFDTGYMATAAIGYQAAPGFRGEFETGYQNADGDGSSESSALSLMGNVYYDMNFQKLGITSNYYANMFTPYVGVGAGAAHLNLNDFGVNGNSSNGWEFAYQGMAGASVNFTPNVSMSLEYRYFDTTERNDADVSSHNLLAGVKFKY